MDDFASAEQALVVAHQVAQTIGPDDLHRPTPCRDFDVEALADHLTDTIARLGVAVAIEPTVPESVSIDQRIQRLTQPILAEWRGRGSADDVVFGGRTLPGHLALGILCLELLVHSWDFAVALDRPIHVSDGHAAHVLGLARQTLTVESRVAAGFDPPVRVPSTASTFDKLVAFTGRDPVPPHLSTVVNC